MSRKHSEHLADLLDALVAFVRGYVVMPAAQADAVALWAVHTHVLDAFEQTPFLALTSPEKQCGKSRTLDVLELVVARPWRTIMPSEAVLFRKIDAASPTLMLDEADAIFDRSNGSRESVRKCRTVLGMVLDYSGVVPNAARDRRLKLPLAEPDEVEPPHADHVEAAAWLLAPAYLIGLLVLDASGARVGEVAAARIGDLDENRRAWLVRAKVAKTRRARWVELPEDLFRVVVEWLPAREDRDPEAPLFPIVSTDRLRMAIGRACRDAAVPSFSPHDLRHRRISLLHHQGVSWAEIGARVGQRNISTTADIYSHVLMDYREIDRPKLLERVRTMHTPVHTSEAANAVFAATF